MAPSDEIISAALKSKVQELFSNDLPGLTVKRVRESVEKELGLDVGQLAQGPAKEKWKKLIKELAAALIEGAEEIDAPPAPVTKPKKPSTESKKPAPAKKGTKRAAQNTKNPPRKRQKKVETSSEEEDISEASQSTPEESDAEESAASDFEESEDSDAPKKKKKSAAKERTLAKRKATKKAKVASDGEDEDVLESEDDSPKKRKRISRPDQKLSRKFSKSKEIVNSDEDEESDPAPSRSKQRSKVKVSDEEDEVSDESPKKKTTTSKKHTPKKAAPSKDDSEDEKGPETVAPTREDNLKSSFTKAPDSDAEDKSKPVTNDSESEMSIVLDEPPKPKRKRKSKSSSEKDAKPKTKTTKARTPAAQKDLTPDEALIKTLQSQLKKCGVNKIWQFELKSYGDNTKAKIKHLQNALKELGMPARFSESRAREIKEMRELQADVEAVMEGEKSWGVDGGRASRSAAKKKIFKEPSASEDEDGEDGKKTRGSSGSEQPVERKPFGREALDWLGDEEDSDE